jgi:exopolysaccharide biosynthesis polyprenyl glycosylphosphotransferase
MDTEVDEHQTIDGVTRSTQISQATSVWAAEPVRRIVPAPAIETRLRQQRTRKVVTQVGLAMLDATMINLAFLLAYLIRYGLLSGVRFTTVYVQEPFTSFRQLEGIFTLGLLAILWARGLYRLRVAGTWFRQVWIVLSATTAAFAVYSAYDFVARKTDVAVDARSRSLVVLAWIAIIVVVSAARLGVAGALDLLYRRGVGLTNLLVVGSGRLGKLTLQQIAASPHLGYRVIGFLHDQDGPMRNFGRFRALGTLLDLDRVLARREVAEVIIALPSSRHHQILRTMRHCERAGVSYRLVPHLYELSLSRIEVEMVQGIPLIGPRRSLSTALQYRMKRVLDIVGAVVLLAIAAPIWLATAMAVALDSPGPVLLRQCRVGLRGAPFQCLKFRSMRCDAERERDDLVLALGDRERGKFKLRDDPRRTRIGRLIRRLSVDELPQLLNVLRGEMSLVGPRPPLPVEYAQYEEWEKTRLEVLPGITGLWQVRGRSTLDFNEMVLMDLYYIEHWSIGLDIQILLRTIPAVVAGRGAY